MSETTTATAETQDQPSVEVSAEEKARAKAMEEFKRTLGDTSDNEPDAEEDTDGAADEAAGSEAGSEDEGDDEEARFQAALRAVVRSKVPKSVREGMSRDDILAWGEQLIPQQARVDEAFAALKGNKPSEGEPEGADTESTEAKRDPPAVTDTKLKELATGLAEDLGLEEDGASKLQEFAKAIAASIPAPQAPETGPYEEQIGMLGRGYVEVAQRLLRFELGERFPEVKDPAVWSKVWDTFQKIRPAHTSMDEAADTAAEMVTASLREREDKKETARASSARPSTRRKPASALTPEERFRRNAEAAIRFGSDVEAARRWAGT